MFVRLVVSLALLVNAFAFQAPSTSILSRQSLKMQDTPTEPTPSNPTPAVTNPTPITPPPVERRSVAPPRKAAWLPIGNLNAPKILDGTLAADAGFDPFGFAKSKNALYWMREAEIRHSRLAMLAAVGWPISELYHKEIAQVFGLSSILASNDRAPSLLNGGLANGWAEGILVMSVLIAGILEGIAMNSGEVFYNTPKPANYVPGNYGFDPLNLYKIRGNKKDMEAAEIKNGRLAMLAITAYAFQEFFTKVPVVQETPYLF